VIAKKFIGYLIIICTVVFLWFINSLTQLDWRVGIITFFGINVLFIVGIVIFGKREYKYYDDYLPFVSVVIAAKDEDEVIEDTIRNVEKSNYEDLELIVVDDASTDSTPDILDRLSKEFANLTVIHVPKEEIHGKAAALNRVAKVIKGEIILILDADNRISQEYVKNVVKIMKPSDIGAVQTSIRVYNEKDGFIPLAYDTDQIITNVILSRGLFPPRSRGRTFLRREVIEKIFPLNENTINEDQQITDRVNKEGYKMINFDKEYIYEIAPTTFNVVRKQRLRWFKGSFIESLQEDIRSFWIFTFWLCLIDFGILDVLTGKIFNIFSILLFSLITSLFFALIYVKKEERVDRLPQRFLSLIFLYFVGIFLGNYSLLISPAIIDKSLKWYKTPRG
jgi:cellulose synthase/poly-beta-1,6-N-acetylglucosamine synthase-like glycosyltransferase